MVEFERIYGDRVNLFGAILGRISRPNKLPLGSWVNRGRWLRENASPLGGERSFIIIAGQQHHARHRQGAQGCVP
jgi:hypothetical protein